jgi:hypothetical protein
MSEVGQRGSQPRRHHFLPVFYLAHFTDTDSREGRLWVLDQSEAKQWPATPIKAAFETDYYRTKFKDGGDEFRVERALAELESEFSPVYEETICQCRVPTGIDLNTLLNFVTLIAIRGPRLRSMVRQLYEQAAHHVHWQIARDEKAWEDAKAYARKLGTVLPADVPYASVERLLKAGRLKVAVNLESGHYIKHMFALSGPLLPALHQRHWSLSECADDAPDLICCDSPVSLSRLPTARPNLPLGFGVPGTAVTLPLTKRLLLSGVLGEFQLARSLSAQHVAWFNSLAGGSAIRFLYTPSKEFQWTNWEGRISTAAELIEFFRQKTSTNE